jgi:hypothetical protein
MYTYLDGLRRLQLRSVDVSNGIEVIALAYPEESCWLRTPICAVLVEINEISGSMTGRAGHILDRCSFMSGH